MAPPAARPRRPVPMRYPTAGRALRAVPVLALLLALAACAAPPPEGSATADEAGFATDTTRKAVTARREMVAAAHPLASEAGLRILREGGNALDAAVAVQAMLTLVEPQSSGLGGGGFLMHFNGQSGEISTYEGRETAPSATTETMFMGADGKALPRERYRVGGISAAVPGALRMLEMAHKAHGKLPWRRLFAPAIEAARDGFTVTPRLNRSIASDRFLRDYAAGRAYLYDSAGQPVAVGTRLRNPALADTLKRVADGGANAFYAGPIAEDIARAVRSDNARPGRMTAADVTAYTAHKRRQLCGPYRTWLVCGFGPPTAGGVATLMTLAMLERFELSKLKPNSPEAVHLIAEATRLVNADRLRYVGDPAFVDVPLAGMLDLSYLARRSGLIDPARAIAHVSPGRIATASKRMQMLAPSEDTESPSTTHISIVDKDGNAVSFTTSIGDAFGSRLFVRGFFLNNHATDFSAVPRTSAGRPKANRPESGKRARSSQNPILVFDGSGRLVMVVGSPGGTRIIAFVVKTLIAALDWNMDVQAAIALPNFAVRDDTVEIERGTALDEIVAPLRAMGHKVRSARLTSGLQAVSIKDGVLTGGADPRREGIALGD